MIGKPPSAGGPDRYVNPARTYPKQNRIAANKDIGRGEYLSVKYPNNGTGRYKASSPAIEIALT